MQGGWWYIGSADKTEQSSDETAGICSVRANESIAGQERFALRISWGGRTEAWPSGHEKKTRKTAWLACWCPTLCAHGANGTMPSLRRWFWARLNVALGRVAADLLAVAERVRVAVRGAETMRRSEESQKRGRSRGGEVRLCSVVCSM